MVVDIKDNIYLIQKEIKKISKELSLLIDGDEHNSIILGLNKTEQYILKIIDHLFAAVREIDILTNNEHLCEFVDTFSEQINIEYDEKYLKICVPQLLEKKNNTGLNSYKKILVSMLRLAADKFCNTRKIHRYDDFVIIFKHIYSISLPEKNRRDHDNVDLSQYINAITDKFALSDAPKNCCHFSTSELGDSNKTEIYLVNRIDFSDWLYKYWNTESYKIKENK